MNLRAFPERPGDLHRVLRRLRVLGIAVVEFDLRLSGASLRFVNVGYILLLAWVGLLIFLIADYRRQRGFYRRLIEAVDSQDPQLAAVLDEAADVGAAPLF